jgi:HEAT repeat protein
MSSDPRHGPNERQLAQLRDSGRMSKEEVAALESAGTDEARDAIMRGIRARHAAARLEAAVAAGDISADRADSLVEEVRRGNHSSALRRRINELARRTPSNGNGTA